MAQLPPGTLMQRAAAGLASVCAGLVARCPGPGSWCSRAAATTAATRCSREPGWPAAGPRCWRSPRARGCTRRAPRRCAPRAAGWPARTTPRVPAAIGAADLILDGLLGIGGRGGLREPQAALAGLAAGSPAVVVAVDLPSGVDADTGVVGDRDPGRRDGDVRHPEARPADGPGARHAGVVELIDIGLGPYLDPPDASALQAADVGALLPQPGGDSDKYRRGVVGIVAGSERFTGAAALAVGGAMRGGAGMVRLVSAAPAVAVVRLLWPEAVITVTGQDTRPARTSTPPGGSRPGWRGRAWAPMTRPGSGWPRCWPATSRCWWTRTG